jgi:hypothetical protein
MGRKDVGRNIMQSQILAAGQLNYHLHFAFVSYH